MNTEAEKIEDEEDDFEVEIIDDRPEEDRRAVKKAEKKDDEDEGDDEKPPSGGDDDEDEMASYSQSVQKRIKKLRFEYHEERRAKEEAKRLADESVKQTQRERARAEQLQRQLQEGEGLLYSQAGSRLKAEIAAAERAFKDSYESGDSEKVTEAQSKLARLQAEAVKLEAYRPRQRPQQRPQHETPQQQRPAPAPKRQASEKAVEWAKKNTWFNRDRKMTGFAYGVHEDLVTNKGLNPESPEYYRQIDQEMRKTFPDYFGQSDDEAADDPGTVVAAPSRKAAKRPRTVRLTATQVALCKRLGITEKQYAAQLLKEQEQSNG